MPLRINSIVGSELSKYRELKLAGGLKAQSIDRYVSYIDDFYLENKITEITFTKEMYSSWIKPRNPDEGNYVRYTRTNYLIEFLSYLSSCGYEVLIPRRLPYKPTCFIARIFTDEELIKYIEYIDTLLSCTDSLVKIAMPVIFRVLIGCGTRVGETLALRVEDVDLKEGILHLKETKNYKFRCVHVSASLLTVLKQYADKCLYLKTHYDFFFSHIDGTKISENSVYHAHRKALTYAEIPYIGSTKGPRLHDLRHTFAVNSLKQFEHRGCDLNNVLPILMKYMGHASISATEKYLQLVSENYDDVLKKTGHTEDIIMGEADYEE